MADRSAPADSSGADVSSLLTPSPIYAFGTALNRVGVFLLLPVYTNYLSVAEYGRLELFYALAAIAGGLLSVGLAHATLRFYFEFEDPRDRRQVVSTNLIAATALGLFGALLLLPYSGSVSTVLFGDATQALGIGIVLTTMVLELSTQIGLAYLRASERSKLFVGAVVIRLLVQVGVNTWLVVGEGAGVVGVLTGNCLAVAVGWGLVVAVTVRDCGIRFSVAKARPVFAYSFPFLLSSAVGIVAANVDRVFIRSLLSFEALGLFALATKFSRLLEELIGVPFSRAYGAFRFSVMHQSNAAAMQSRVTRALFAVCLLAGLGVLLFAGDVLTLLSDASFGAAADLLPLLICASIARVMSYPMQTGILVRKSTREIFYVNLIDSLLYVGGSLALIRWFGIVGACLALATTSAVMLLLTNRFSQRHVRVDYQYGRWVRLALIALGAALAGVPFIGAPLLIGVPFKLLILTSAAAAMLTSSAFDDEERDLAFGFARTLSRRFPWRRQRLLPAGGA